MNRRINGIILAIGLIAIIALVGIQVSAGRVNNCDSCVMPDGTINATSCEGCEDVLNKHLDLLNKNLSEKFSKE